MTHYLRVQLEMPHTYIPISRISLSAYLVTTFVAILRKVRSSLCYTLMADEGTHWSNKEKICIVIWYVESETASIRKDHVTFLECDSGTTGKALADKMLSFVRNQLDPSKLHGQVYDGESNISGKTNRAAARIFSQ